MRTDSVAPGESDGLVLQRRVAALCLSSGASTDATPPSVDALTATGAAGEGLAPLLGARLDDGRLAAAAPAVHDELTRAYHRCLAWTLFANASIRELVYGLKRAGIPAVALKGSALIRSVMKPGERPMVDIDVLVPASAWADASRIARETGASVFDPLDRPITAAHDYALPMRTREGLLVELHRYLCERPLFRPVYDGPNGIFARAIPASDDLLVPDPADLFLGLAIHAAHHAYHLPLRAIVDGLILGTSPALALPSVVARAQHWRAATATAAYLLVLRNFGLRAAGVDAAIAALDPRGRLGPMLADAPWPERDVHRYEWRRRWRVTRLLDGKTAAVGYVGQRIGLRIADVVWNRYARLKR